MNTRERFAALGEEIIYPALLFVLLSAWSWKLITDYPMILEFNDALPLARAMLGQFIVADGSILSIIYPHIETSLPGLMAAATSLGPSLETIQLLMVHTSMWFGFCGIYIATWRLSRSHWAGLVASVLLTGTWLTSLTIGYGLFFWMHHPSIGAMSGAWIVGTWALWLNLDGTKSAWPIPYALVAAIFYIHPTNAIILGCCFGFSAVITTLRAGPKWKETLPAWFGVAVMALGVLPKAIGILLSLGSFVPSTGFDPASWWALMAVRKPHHVFMWTGRALLSFSLLVVLSSIFIRALSKHLSSRRTDQLLGTLIPCVAFGLLGYAVVGIWPTPRLAGLVLSRSLDLVIAMTLVCSVAFAGILSFSRSGSAKRSLSGLALMAVIVLGGISDRVWLHGAEIGAGVLLIAVVVLILHPRYRPPGSRWASRATSIARVTLPIALGATALVSSAYKANSDSANLAANRSPPLWAETTAWIRENTPANSLLLMPPIPYGTDASRRSNVLDHFYAGYSVYVFQALPFEVEAFKLIYGFDLTNKTVADVRAITENPRYTYSGCVFEEGYLGLLADPQRVVDVQEHYSVDYIVGFQPGVMPEQWSCSTLKGKKLNYPIVFENSIYVVYATRK